MDERQPVSFPDSGIIDQLLLEPTLPKIEIFRGNRFHVPCGNRDGRDFVANEPMSVSASVAGSSVR